MFGAHSVLGSVVHCYPRVQRLPDPSSPNIRKCSATAPFRRQFAHAIDRPIRLLKIRQNCRRASANPGLIEMRGAGLVAPMPTRPIERTLSRRGAKRSRYVSEAPAKNSVASIAWSRT